MDLKHIRNSKNLSQLEAAQITNISLRTYKRLELDPKYIGTPKYIFACEKLNEQLIKSDIDNMTQSIMDTFTDLGIIPDDNKFVVQELNIRNVGYAKNCFITKVLIEPYNLPQLNDKKDYKNVDLKEMKQSLLFYSDLR